ncbi:FadR/GntR family transcriptional regulator [Xanthobacter autotrophicus]|uniref:FadR/GntR family transcriptional regulator n=1 Tax=Xanthobacter autotrophicus TaxID=280 RepID=UPI0024A6A2C7|nr:FadR/GntR family transcriptional regulator [Xanthobacter autotrophicus]MDI4658178.1 FadR family transcriptional regulator [Xanthobacter autotrophicus]
MAQPRDIIGRAPSLAETLAHRLREEIASGRLQPGERLPTEHQMAETYGVSRPIVREAVGRLKHDGLVTTRQGAGAFVAEPGAASTFRLDIADLSDKVEMRAIVELLMAVEATATAHAAVRRSDEDLARIGAQLDAMQDAIDRGEPGVDEDMAFHRAIVEATGNPYFRDLSQFLDHRVRYFIRTARANTARLGGLPQAVQREHEAIFGAIGKKDPVAARAAAEEHLRNAAARLAVYLTP